MSLVTGNAEKLVTVGLILALSFSVNAKETFGDGSGSLPEIQNITVYNVTGETGSDRDTGGEILTSGLNRTFALNRTQDLKDYRFTFEIQNTGSEYWNLSSEDRMFHEGLDPGWSLDKSWYNISGTRYEGGNFTDGRVNWNTSKGGNLSPDSRMYANYIIETDISSSEDYSPRFLVNDSSDLSGSEDFHQLDLNRLGELDLTLNEPPQNTVLTQNKTFQLNTTVKCIEGECGDVKVAPRYNESSVADTVIPEDQGEPFNTQGSNLARCQRLLSGESCYALFQVNATGSQGESYLLDANATSSYSEIEGNDTGDNQVQINQVAAINLSWSTVDFGTLDPDDENQSAAGNYDRSYNVSVLENSNAVDLWIKGQDLNSVDTGYSIGIGNMSYAKVNSTDDMDPIGYGYDLIEDGVSYGSPLTMFYWLDVPTGIIKGDYQGSITIKANVTG